MRSNNRILKILKVDFPVITFVSNNGDFRLIDIKKLFKKLKIEKDDWGYQIVTNKEVFGLAEVVDKAIAWKSISKKSKLSDGKEMELFFHLDPIVTIENSSIDEESNKLNFGKLIRSLRKARLGITQQELGERIGSDKQYVSKIENNKTDIEFRTLRKIYEVGLDLNIFIAHYRCDNFLEFTNSICNQKFLDWAERNKSNLQLVEGIGTKISKYLISNSIETTEELSRISFSELLELLLKKNSLEFYHHPDSWLTQSKLIANSDWINLIKVQRNISSSDNASVYSKIEGLAREELGKELYLVG